MCVRLETIKKAVVCGEHIANIYHAFLIRFFCSMMILCMCVNVIISSTFLNINICIILLSGDR